MRKIGAVILALCLLLGTTAFAAGQNETVVTYVVSPGYTVTIPSTLTMTNGSGSMTVSINSDAIFEAGQTVSVAITDAKNYSNGFRLSDSVTPVSTYLSYSIQKNGTDVALNEAFVTWSRGNTGSALLTLTAATPTVAGTYTDLLTFTVSSAVN